MNPSFIFENFKSLCGMLLAFMLIGHLDKTEAQNCPASVPSTISSNPDTYYPGLGSTVNAGATSITLGTAGYGTTPIASGDLLLIIQMQGAQINSANTSSYGNGVSGGSASGYLSNTAMMAGNMEYIVATNAIPLAGGILTLLHGTVNSFKNAAFGTDGQYRFQVVRIGLYYSLTLNGTLTAPSWNGTTGGVLVLSVTNNLNINSQTISAAGAGFRGGAGRQLSGGTGGLNSDLVSMSTSAFNGSKGEGIGGTPRFINNNGTLYDNGSANEGYPNGSYAAGAPGNAGGGGTDGHPSANDQNSGGGGGANGGVGGRGGNSWSSNLATGGEPGAVFQEKSPSRLIMGGGGGAGTTNDGTGTPGIGFSSSGAAGGGIVLITAGSISGTGTIDVNGASGNTTVVNDGSGGAGAGGSVLLYAGSGLSGVTVLAKGGTGGTNSGGSTPPQHGPGGGGGGGVIYSNAAVNAASSVSAGISGYTTSGVSYGAATGTNGILVQNITIVQVPNQYLSCSILPVRFKSITARLEEKEVVISWDVTNEAAVKNYVVEESTDNKNFSAAGIVAYHDVFGGDNNYSFTDAKNYGSGIIYYRIKELSEDGSAIYSSVVNIRKEEEGTEVFSVSPNPVAGPTASIRFTAKTESVNAGIIRMLSVNGATVWQKQYKAVAGINVVPVDNLMSIPNGLYFIQYYNGRDIVNVKMIVGH